MVPSLQSSSPGILNPNRLPPNSNSNEASLRNTTPAHQFRKSETAALAMAGAQHPGSRKRTPPFPTRQLTILGKFPRQILSARRGDCRLTLDSHVSNLRTDCLHEHLSLRLLHDQGLWDCHTRCRDLCVRRNGDISVCVRRVLVRCRMGQA
jgi:hypothetical protein